MQLRDGFRSRSFHIVGADLIHQCTNGFVLLPLLYHGREVVRSLNDSKGPLSLEEIANLASVVHEGPLNVFLRVLRIAFNVDFDQDGKYSVTERIPFVPNVFYEYWVADFASLFSEAELDDKIVSLLNRLELEVSSWSYESRFEQWMFAVVVEKLLFAFFRVSGNLNLAVIVNASLRLWCQSILLSYGIFENDKLSHSGQYVADRLMLLGQAESYFPMLRKFKEMLFGDLSSVFLADGQGHETHVERLLNIQLSGFWHQKYFSEMCKIVLNVFDNVELKCQPMYVCDMGCGDGSLLKMIYEVVRNNTVRGKHLKNFPLVMIGADYSEESRLETDRVLLKANIPHFTVFADIGDPDSLLRQFDKRGVDANQVMHVRSFLDHDRPFIPSAHLKPGSAVLDDNAFMNRKGHVLSAASVLQSLEEHLERWAVALKGNAFGLLLLEVHNIGIQKTKQFVDDLESFHFDVTQSLSGQYVVSALSFLQSAARVGLLSSEFMVFPSRDVPRISISRLICSPFRVRQAEQSDLPQLLMLERFWSSPLLAASEATLKERLLQFPVGQLVSELISESRVIGAAYSRPILDLESLMHSKASDNLLLLNGTTLQLLGAVSDPIASSLAPVNSLIEFLLKQAPLCGFGVVVGVTRFSGFKKWKAETPAGTLEQYYALDNDPTVEWHKSRGAKIEGLILDFRPADKENEGAGIGISYDFIHRFNFVRKAAVYSIDHVQEKLKIMIADMLGMQGGDVSVSSSFFELGLDSLSFFELRRQISVSFGISPPKATVFFEFPTIEKFARYLGGVSVEASVRSPLAMVKGNSTLILGLSCTIGDWRGLQQVLLGFQTGVDIVVARPPNRAELIDVSFCGAFFDKMDVWAFDCEFWTVSPREVGLMDPQQRLILNHAWHALEDATVDVSTLESNNTGIFIGLWNVDFRQLSSAATLDAGKSGNLFLETGSAASVVAGRVAYLFDWQGPTVVLDTACSSGLVAAAVADVYLAQGKCLNAMVGSANAILGPNVHRHFSAAGMLSPDSRCKTFDASANGYVRSEAVACAFLSCDASRVARAELLAIDMNQDGRSAGLTVPNKHSQQNLLGSVRHQTKEVVASFETHGTGTSLGDPIEVAAIAHVRADRSALILGASKSHCGHTESPSGLVGLIKALEQPGSRVLHFATLNPHISVGLAESSRFVIPLETICSATIHASCVSSFGFSGTNSHCIARPVSLQSKGSVSVLVVSANCNETLKKLCAIYAENVRSIGGEPISNWNKRSRLTVQLSFTGENTKLLYEQLVAICDEMKPAAALYPFATVAAFNASEKNAVLSVYVDYERSDYQLFSAKVIPYVSLFVSSLTGRRFPTSFRDVLFLKCVTSSEYDGLIVKSSGSKQAFSVDGDVRWTCMLLDNHETSGSLRTLGLDLRKSRKWGNKTADGSVLYNILDDKFGLQYGPSFQIVTRYEKNGEYVRSSLKPHRGEEGWTVPLVDSCFHALVHISLIESGVVVPFHFEESSFFGNPVAGQSMVVDAVRRVTSAGLAKFDVAVGVEGGTLLAVFRGVTIKVVDVRTLLSEEVRECYQYECVWTVQSGSGRLSESVLLVKPDECVLEFLDDRQHMPICVPALVSPGNTAETPPPPEVRVLNELIVAYVITAFAKLDKGGNAIVRLKPRNRMCKMLEEQGFQNFRSVEHLTRILQESHAIAPEFALARACGPFIDEVLSGARDPLALIFPNGNDDMVTALYRDSLCSMEMNKIAAAQVIKNVSRPNRFVRILEIGAGTGGTTHFVLQALESKEVRFSYLFTDISLQLLNKSKKRFETYGSCMQFRMFDVETDTLDGQFDVIVASNVLHATRVMKKTMRTVLKLLAPGGVLVAPELTHPSPLEDISFGLLEGWWLFDDHDLRTEHPLLNVDTWSELLSCVGFSDISFEGTHPDSWTVVTARCPRQALEYSVAECKEGSIFAMGESEKNFVLDWTSVDHMDSLLAKVRPVIIVSGFALAHQLRAKIMGNIAISKAFAKFMHQKEAKLVILTVCSQKVIKSDIVSGYVQGMIWGLGRVIRAELSPLRVILADVECSTLSRSIFDLSDDEEQAVRGGYWWRPVMRPCLEKGWEHVNRFEGRVVFIIGGFEGLGLLVTNAICTSIQVQGLSLCGPQGATDETFPKMASCTIMAASVDASKSLDVECFLWQSKNGGCVGTSKAMILYIKKLILQEKLTRHMEWADFQCDFAESHAVLGSFARYCHGRCELFLLNSDVGLFGPQGQANCAASCTFMDALAMRFDGIIHLNWTTRKLLSESKTVEQSGITLKHAVGFASRCQHKSVVGVFGLDFQESAAKISGETYLHQDLPNNVEHVAVSLPRDVERTGSVVEEVFRAVVGMDALVAIDLDRPFSSFGMDSIMALEFRDKLAAVSKKPDLPATLIFDYPSIRAVQLYLQTQVGVLDVESANKKLLMAVRGSPKAVVSGSSCRFGRAFHLTDFWAVIVAGEDSISEVGTERWSWKERGNFTRWGGFFVGLKEFDAGFFGISPREALWMDPQHRMLLECAWEAIEAGAYDALNLKERRLGVFVGICMGEYWRRFQTNEGLEFAGTGTVASTAAGRVSYTLGTVGTTVSIDTACSSSLVAFNFAVTSLVSLSDELSLCLGVQAQCAEDFFLTLGKVGMLSPDGRCKTFDERANGFGRAEGCGGLLIERDGCRKQSGLVSVVGYAVNQDGRTNGLTAPNGPSQVRLIREALEKGGLAEDDLSLLEAHGTGTSLGDPIEVQAAEAALGRMRNDRALIIGTVKTIFGHAEAAAGVLGLLKTVICMERDHITPNLHLQRLNVFIGTSLMERTRAVVPLEGVDWSENRRFAGVSSFGFSGTNAHVVVEMKQEKNSQVPDVGGSVHIRVSAKSKVVVSNLGSVYANWLVERQESAVWFGRVSRKGRALMEHVLHVSTETRKEGHRLLLKRGSETSANSVLQDEDAEPTVMWCYTPTYPFERTEYWMSVLSRTEVSSGVVRSMIHEVVWVKTNPTKGCSDRCGTWILVGSCVLSDEIGDELRAQGDTVVKVTPSYFFGLDGVAGYFVRTTVTDFVRLFSCLKSKKNIKGMVSFLGFDSKDSILWQVEASSALMEALKVLDWVELTVFWMSSGTSTDCWGPMSDSRQAVIVGMALGWSRRLPNLFFVIDAADVSTSLLVQEFHGRTEALTVLRSQERYAPRCRPVSFSAAHVEHKGAVMIFSGLSKVGQTFVMELLRYGWKSVVVVDTLRMVEESEFSLSDSKAFATMLGLTISVIAADITNRDEVRSLMREVTRFNVQAVLFAAPFTCEAELLPKHERAHVTSSLENVEAVIGLEGLTQLLFFGVCISLSDVVGTLDPVSCAGSFFAVSRIHNLSKAGVRAFALAIGCAQTDTDRDGLSLNNAAHCACRILHQQEALESCLFVIAFSSVILRDSSDIGHLGELFQPKSRRDIKGDDSADLSPRATLKRVWNATDFVVKLMSQHTGVPLEDLSEMTNFSDIGMDSLTISSMVDTLSELTRTPVRVVDLMAQQTLGNLASFLEKNFNDGVLGEKMDELADEVRVVPVASATEAVERDEDDLPFLARYGLCRVVVQVFLLGIITGIVGVSFFPAFLFFQYTSSVSFVLYPVLFTIQNLSLMLLVLCSKWIVVGRYHPGVHKIWSWSFVIWWFMDRLQKWMLFWVGSEHLRSTIIATCFYIAMGAKLHPACVVDEVMYECDLVRLEDFSGTEAQLSAARLEDGALLLGPIRLGEGSWLGVQAVVEPFTCVPSLATVDDASCLMRGTKMDSNHLSTLYRGSPAASFECGLVRSFGPKWRALFVIQSFIEWSVFSYVQSSCVILSFAPAFLLFDVINRGLGKGFAIGAVPLLCILSIISLLLTVCLVKWILLGRVRTGIYNRRGWYSFRRQVVRHVYLFVDNFLFLQNTSKFLQFFLRLMGVGIGSDCLVGLPVKLQDHDLIHIDSGAFVAAMTYFKTWTVQKDKLVLAEVQVGRSSWVGTGCVLQPGAVVPNGAAVAGLSLVTNADYPVASLKGIPCQAIGSVPVIRSHIGYFSATEGVQQVFFGFCSFVMFGLCIVCGYFLMDFIYVALPQSLLYQSAFVFSFSFVIAVVAVFLCLCIVAILVRRLVMTPLASDRRISRLHGVFWLTNVMEGFVWMTSGLLFGGSELMNLVLRGLGATVEEGAYVEPLLLADPPMLRFGRRSTLRLGIIEAHAPPHGQWLMEFGLVQIGPHSSVERNSLMIFPVDVGAHVRFGALSRALVGQRILANTTWIGSPAVQIQESAKVIL